MTDTSNKKLYAIAFVAAIVSTMFWVLFIVSGAPELPPFSEADARYQAIVENSPTYLTYGWAGTFGAFLTVPYLVGVLFAVRSRGPHVWLILIIGVVGAVLTAVAFMGVSLSAFYFAMEAIDPAGPALRSDLVALQIASDMLETGWFIGSFLCYGLAIAWAAYEALRAECGPRWLNWLGIVGGVAGVVWLRPFIPFLLPAGLIGSLANILLLSIWAIGLTWVIWRRES